MSAFSANRFALLDEGADSDQDERQTKPQAKAPKGAAVAKPIPAPTSKPKTDAGAKRSDYPARGGARRTLREDRPAGETAGTDEARETRGERGGGARGGRGGRGGRGAGGRGRGRGAKPERLDRQSATGVTDTEKKIASGWGAEEGEKELQAENEGWGDAKAETSVPGTPGANGAPAASTDGAAPATAAATEEEEKVKTLDEYLAERAAATRIGPTLEGRQANEGADSAQWKDGVQLLRSEKEDSEWFMGKAKKAAAGAQKEKKGKTFIEVEPQGYRPPESGRGARGGARGRGGADRGRGEGRRGGRGEGFRGGRGEGFRGGRGTGPRQSQTFNANDATAFPSLS